MKCVSCDNVINNPICSECLASRMREMVSEFDSDLAKQIHPVKIEGDATCLSCNKKMGLCASCFTMDIYELILEKNPDIAKHFKKNFDFDLRKNLL